MFLLSTSVLIIASVSSIVWAEDSIEIGKFHPIAHGVKSGQVKIVDDKTIKIKDFHYDGKGPDAWFVVGTDDKYTEERPSGGLPFNHIVPDENGSCEKPKGYDGKTIELTLPGNVTIADIKYLALYCIKYNHNFGYVKIPKDIKPQVGKFDGPTKSCRSAGTKANAGGGLLSLWPVIIVAFATMLR